MLDITGIVSLPHFTESNSTFVVDYDQIALGDEADNLISPNVYRTTADGSIKSYQYYSGHSLNLIELVDMARQKIVPWSLKSLMAFCLNLELFLQ